ncbi:MAG: DUF222 domain-containing protein [Acidimicrobiaceae bacterium]|nr:DUF222 domain-containing protein [Acidimicrobiaceae bacterium]MXZ65134.1 DUF222 domain-containing protein [Acidimicrobiaceae bacterium]MYF32792.1 DUF222 domain-containing protein [Acidimicrobiaceae bacterium]MYG79902.1 DUF222 domain-containing protein [Acidimicrobiaceae bacterium]MYJ36224.1 DUF222 domain-containing protein [Acidimicrobiaceae bacterium]
MLIEAARRAEAAVKEMLSFAHDGSATTDEFRDALEITESFVRIASAFQTSAAAAVAGREQHGDGGAEVLATSTGLSRPEAHSRVKTAEALRDVPAARQAVESGRVSPANARRLADAIDKAGAKAVGDDGGLLANAESMRPEQFSREARRWVVTREDDGGESEHRRQRARRHVRLRNADDGMVHLYGEFDAATGQRIGNRLRAEASRMHEADKRAAAGSGSDRQTFAQCMADALDNLTAGNAASDGKGKPIADICVVAHVDNETGNLIAELPDGDRLPPAVLEEFACNAKFTGVVYDRKGKPIWRAESCRTATEAQRQILLARYGGCFHCAAHPALCQVHHIRPVSQGGSTKISNMVPVCWHCHQRIHHHKWQIRTTNGVHTLHPPGRVHCGPAHAPDEPVLHLPGITPDAVQPRPEATDDAPESQERHPPRIAHAPDPPPEPLGSWPEPCGARAGPAAARAALRDARVGSG